MDNQMWTRGFVFGATCLLGLLLARKRQLHRFHAHILSSKSHDFGRFFGIDIGGTLAKLVYFQPDVGSMATHLQDASHPHQQGCLTHIQDFLLRILPSSVGNEKGDRSAVRDDQLTLYVPHYGGTLHFCSFQTAKMEVLTNHARDHYFHRYIKSLACTGGGAFKFARLFDEKLGISIEKKDEMDALIKGLNFVLQYAPDECYTYTDVELGTSGLGTATYQTMPIDQDTLYPFLLVNIGSGVSILKVSSPSDYKRVSGTSLGGGTFWGLCRSLSHLHSFDEAMDAAIDGDSTEVDMSVGDIYGTNRAYPGKKQFHLKPTTVASSFGKAGAQPHSYSSDSDKARALLFMITQNLGQVAYLNARRFETSRIYFCGNFLRKNEVAARQLSHAIHFWSDSKMQAQFFRHEGFFGALGSFLEQYESKRKQKSKQETGK